jgi:flavin reductase (DIM6/NTAB) family NADH-FMN oxidoreductase RutF
VHRGQAAYHSNHLEEANVKKSLGARSLVYVNPVLVVGTYDKAGKPNAMTVAWGGICCSRPPCIAVSMRRATYTYDNIVERKAFTVNVPSEAHVKEADYFGIVSGRLEDKFAKTGLTPVRSDLVDAPYVGEFLLVLECQLLNSVDIGGHTHFIGEILDVKVDESVLRDGEKVDIQKLRPMIYDADTRAYFGVGEWVAKAFSVGRDV